MKSNNQAVAYIASVTAYNADETINYDATRQQYRRIIQKGGSVFCGGTNGDFSALLEEERLKIVEIALEEGGKSIIANAGCPSTFATIKLANQFASMGSPAVAVIAPFFIACSQEGLYSHYTRIADSVKCPVYLYNIPSRTGNPLEPELVSRLADHPNILGIKDSSGSSDSLDGFLKISEEIESFNVMSGSDAQILEGLQKGTSGCVSGLGNVVPEWVVDICSFYCKGDIQTAREIQQKLTGFRTDLYALGFAPALVKRALYVMDPTVGNNRNPALVASPALDKEISAILDKYNIKYE